MPALYRLACDRRLPPGFAVVGTSRTPLSDEQFREKIRGAIAQFSGSTVDGDMWRAFSGTLFYTPGDIGDPESYRRIGARLADVEKRFETGGNALFYLATQPSQYEVAADGIGAAGLARGNGWRRLIIEKPFGHDLASARELNAHLQRIFPESEIYRIDHYLGKETVQNILAFRFANGIFEPLWNRRYVNQVQITAAEAIGVEGRGAYYQEAGALRDMIQNHLLQVTATIGMEPSATYEAGAVRDERAKLLRSIRIMKPDEVAVNAVAGQYGPARIGDKDVPGFLQEPGVRPDSQTDTYAAVTLFCGELALGRRAVLFANRQAPAQTCYGHCDSLQRGAARPLRGVGQRRCHTEPADHPHSAGRRDFDPVSLETAGRRNAFAAGIHGLQLRRKLRLARTRRLRNAAARCDARRLDALHPAGCRRGELGCGRAGSGSVGKPEVRLPELCRGDLGTGCRRRDAGAPRSRLEEPLVPAPLSADSILADLNQLWVSLADPSAAPESQAVLRACAMTLVVVAEESEEAAQDCRGHR